METHNNMLCKIPMEKQRVLVYLGSPTDWVPTGDVTVWCFAFSDIVHQILLNMLMVVIAYA